MAAKGGQTAGADSRRTESHGSGVSTNLKMKVPAGACSHGRAFSINWFSNCANTTLLLGHGKALQKVLRDADGL